MVTACGGQRKQDMVTYTKEAVRKRILCCVHREISIRCPDVGTTGTVRRKSPSNETGYMMPS